MRSSEAAIGAERPEKLSERERATLRALADTLVPSLAVNPDRVGRLGVRENAVGLFSAHPMGSARAGLDPRTSAAGPTGECHEVRNLWIGDGSLLPTTPGVNPMISIMALAARTTGFVHERLAATPR